MKYLLCLMMLFAGFAANAQTQEPEKEDFSQADSINHIYIPRNFGECISELDKILDDQTKKELKESRSNAHDLEIGAWIRNNWGFEHRSRLNAFLKEKRGDFEPDGMSGIILRLYVKYLKGDNEEWQWLDSPEGTLLPVIVLDGVQAPFDRFKTLDTDQIQNIEILKDNSLLNAKYGKQASYNGVILITTIKQE